jgi:hypothetical protein
LKVEGLLGFSREAPAGVLGEKNGFAPGIFGFKLALEGKIWLYLGSFWLLFFQKSR